jgi:predicted nucleic acid-binding protein
MTRWCSVTKRYSNRGSQSCSISDIAARLRASVRLGLADAVQAASALAISAAALVTHDRDFPRLPSLRIIS